MNYGNGRLLASSASSYMDAELPNDDSFVFDGTNSDLAQQLYYRARAGGSAEKLSLTKLPSAVEGRLATLELDWDNLDGIAQRALLWDSGFGFSLAGEPLQIFTDGTHSIADLAIPVSDFEGAGCVWNNCTQTDRTTSYSNLLCDGDQMLTATRCLVEDFNDSSETHTAMWSTGGSPESVPLPYIFKHSWTDASTNKPFNVLAIHTVPTMDEVAYGQCPTGSENGGFSSLVIPCASTANLSDMPGAMMTTVKGSDWVSRWLKENYSTTATPAPAATSVTTVISEDTNNGGAISSAAIAGIIAACIVVVLLILGVVIARRRHTGANQGQTGLWDDDVITANRIPREKVRVNELVSRGAFGEVYTGVFNDQRVAIKMLLPSTRRDIKLVNDFLAEAKLTASMDHPRIVTCIGVAWDSLSDLCVVMEFMEGGDLRTLLSNYEKTGHPVGFNREKVAIALHVCHALTYLHSLEPSVIHRDLKSRNILLNDANEAKLTDFGISRERLDRTMTAGVGTSLWMAPEVMTGERYDEKADMFSFGVVLSELDSHTLPYAQAKQEMQQSHGRQMSDATLLQKVAMGTVSVEFSDAAPRSMVDLGCACVSVDPTLRPSAAEALFKLQVILSKELA
ncbi:hypothetical protein PHYSODRAFT_324311 [Phytophthora sojae]|uniref:Protein kinase domain-containing protein n=1 Tax=Phytophthora sojae (strain P6497) TaxID=1094619 RepID=G4YTC6_PHYSP|nr:hypothetical protein PHYSODRAFT_324311 [Phytophthora sojae]EGZ23048.1 hypothetical protein PHYSODRAFT_324311 [Phytophthora sojae]|eukprot:XP_009518336.1 hypothetical protein PHYSODRAFT_324311 [Phytophthora sojae]